MIDNNQVIDPQMHDFWDNEFKQYGIKVLPETAMFYEMETFFPSYVFVDKQTIDQFGVDISDNNVEVIGSKLAFFTRDDKPFFADEKGNIQWFDIEPMNLYVLRMRMLEIMPSVGLRYGVEGYIIPLQENAFFESQDDVNAYLHNLMFWESTITASQSGPLMQRFFWISQKLYKMRNQQRDSVVMLSDAGFKNLSISEDNYKEIISQILKQRNEYVHGLTEVFAETAKANDELYATYLLEYLRQMKEEEKSMYETLVRQEKMQRQMDEIQCQIREDASRIGEHRERYADIYEKIIELLKGEKK